MRNLPTTRILLNLSGTGRKRLQATNLEEELAKLGHVTLFDRSTESAPHERFLELVSNADIMVTSWQSEFFRPEDVGRTGDLKLVIHGAGSVRRVITPEIIASGVRVVQCAQAIAKAVAHMTVGFILTGLWNAAGLYLHARQGTKAGWPCRDLEDITVGLVGLSQVGRQIPPLLHPFGAKVVAYDPTWTAAAAAELGVELVDLDTLVSSADVVSLHAPVLPQTVNMINAQRIASMRKGALFVNTARPALVDQEALFQRCYRAELTAYLDVTSPEPLPPDHPAWQCPFIFMTPHVAGPTVQTMRRIAGMIIENVRRFQAGEPLSGEVTLERYDLIA